jgi:hypothetical protein
LIVFDLRLIDLYRKNPKTASMKAPPAKAPTAIPAMAPADRDGFEPFELLVVVVVEAIFEVEVEIGATRVSVVEVVCGVEDEKETAPVSVAGILIWIGIASTKIPVGLIVLTIVPIPVVFWSKMLSTSKYVVVLKDIGLWQKTKYGEPVPGGVVRGQP